MALTAAVRQGGGWVASPGVRGSHRRGLERARCPGFGFRRFCLAAVLGLDWRPRSAVREAEAGRRRMRSPQQENCSGLRLGKGDRLQAPRYGGGRDPAGRGPDVG